MAKADADLAERHCRACAGHVRPLINDQIEALKSKLTLDWEVLNSRRLRHVFKFDDFMEAMIFVNDIAAVAEDEGHHPDIYIYYRTVVIELTTHKIEGLSDNDFILARKIELCW